MTTHAPIFARERNAARVLDMTPAEFRALVVRKYAGNARQIMLAKSAKRKRDGG